MRLNVTIVIGALIFVFGAFITGGELFEGGGGGGPFGAILVGPLLIVFGFAMVLFGSRPRRFSKHK